MSTINAATKKRGRPPVDSAEVKIRIRREQIDQIDVWAEQQPDQPGRPEAIRRLIDIALTPGLK